MKGRFPKTFAAVGVALGIVAAQMYAMPTAAAAPSVGPSANLQATPKGNPYLALPMDVGQFGYTEKEYFINGTARAPGMPAQGYKTRVLVYMPKDMSKFNGVTGVEWMNTTFQEAIPIEFQWLYQHVFQKGYGYVQVSNQQPGLCGYLRGSAACDPQSAKGSNPARYQSLHLPSDDYSFDIFSQVGRALQKSNIALNGQKASKLIAIGESQSGILLDRYLRDFDAREKVYDGFFLDGDDQAPLPTRYRVPAVYIWGEESGRPAPAVPNRAIISVTGAPHIDRWAYAHMSLSSQISNGIRGKVGPAEYQKLVRELSDYTRYSAKPDCLVNTLFPRRYVVQSYFDNLVDWVNNGRVVASSPPFQFTGQAQAIQKLPQVNFYPLHLPTQDLNTAGLLYAPFALKRDASGMALGGLRLPFISAPTASYNGALCFIAGYESAYTPSSIKARYGSKTGYLEQIDRAVDRVVGNRDILPSAGQEIRKYSAGLAQRVWG